MRKVQKNTLLCEKTHDNIINVDERKSQIKKERKVRNA